MKKSGKIGKVAAAAVTVAVIGIGGLGYVNPVLAAKIPLIGKIFEKVEDDVTYSGDYTDKGTVLTNEDHAGSLDTSDYSVFDKGITLTASEVYCDGYSIFLTVNMEAEDADFTHISHCKGDTRRIGKRKRLLEKPMNAFPYLRIMLYSL